MDSSEAAACSAQKRDEWALQAAAPESPGAGMASPSRSPLSLSSLHQEDNILAVVAVQELYVSSGQIPAQLAVRFLD